jgi:hypothetical protein
MGAALIHADRQTDGRTKERPDTISVKESASGAIHVTGIDKTSYKVKG